MSMTDRHFHQNVEAFVKFTVQFGASETNCTYLSVVCVGGACASLAPGR